MITTVISIILGALITWVVAKWYYDKQQKDQSIQVINHDIMTLKINNIIENNNQILDVVDSLKIIAKKTKNIELINKFKELSNKLNESKDELRYFKAGLKRYLQAKAAIEILKDNLIKDKGKLTKEHIIRETLRAIRNYCEVSYEKKPQGECYFRVIYWIPDGKGSLTIGGYSFNKKLNQIILSRIIDLKDGSNIISKSYNNKHMYVLSKNDNDNFTRDYYIDDEFTNTSISIPVSRLDNSDIYGVVTIDTRAYKYFTKEKYEMDIFEDLITPLILELAYTERV